MQHISKVLISTQTATVVSLWLRYVWHSMPPVFQHYQTALLDDRYNIMKCFSKIFTQPHCNQSHSKNASIKTVNGHIISIKLPIPSKLVPVPVPYKFSSVHLFTFRNKWHGKFTGQTPFLSHDKWCQSTERNRKWQQIIIIIIIIATLLPTLMLENNEF